VGPGEDGDVTRDPRQSCALDRSEVGAQHRRRPPGRRRAESDESAPFPAAF
jgi:hypothetical protein